MARLMPAETCFRWNGPLATVNWTAHLQRFVFELSNQNLTKKPIR